jgi:hypothetical protein
MAFLGGYVFFVGPLLCFFRGVVAMLFSCFVGPLLCFLRGAIAMLSSCVYGYAFFVGPFLCFLRLDPSLSHFSDVLFRKTNGTTKSRKTTKNAVSKDRS